MEERLPFKEKVGGSSPPGLTESNSALLRLTKAKLDLAVFVVLLRSRLTVGQWSLAPFILVRIQAPQQMCYS